jgi:hypothetical protein
MSELDALQRWFLGAITEGRGLEETARHLRPSRRCSAPERLEVYSNAYTARLVECLGEQFPALRRALGEETFAGFALDYLGAHPSRSWSLNGLGARLAEHLEATRPSRESDTPDWADLWIDLARLEWAVLEVFDGPGLERDGAWSPSELGAVPPERVPALRFALDPSLRLLRLRFPLSDYYGRLRAAPLDEGAEDEAPAPPAPGEELLALHRRDWRVRRFALEPAQHRLLEALQAGAPLADALAAAFERSEPDEQLVRAWFQDWGRRGLFAGLREE